MKLRHGTSRVCLASQKTHIIVQTSLSIEQASIFVYKKSKLQSQSTRFLLRKALHVIWLNVVFSQGLVDWSAQQFAD